MLIYFKFDVYLVCLMRVCRNYLLYVTGIGFEVEEEYGVDRFCVYLLGRCGKEKFFFY